MPQPGKDRSFYSKYFREGTVLHGLQVAPEDREWTLSVPKADVKQTDVVLYLGTLTNVLQRCCCIWLRRGDRKRWRI